MKTKEKTLRELCAGVKLELAPGKPTPTFNDPGAHHYIATLRFKGRKIVTEFHTGSGWKTDPDAHDVMECLLSDANGADGSFEDLCDNCGYDTDSRKAYTIYEACRKMAADLKYLLAHRYDTWMYADRE